MALEKALDIYTKAQVALVSNRVYAIIAPQGVSKPYIVYSVVSQGYSHAMGGDSGLTETVVQFAVVGDTYESTKKVIEQVKTAYRNYIQGVSTTKMANEQWVQATLLSNEADYYEWDTRQYHSTLDVTLWHMEDF